MTPREFTKSLDDLISSPGQRLIGDIVNGYKYEGDKIMFKHEKDLDWLRNYMHAIAKVHGISVETTYDPISTQLHVKFLDSSKPSYANMIDMFDIYLDRCTNIYTAAVEVSLSVKRKVGGCYGPELIGNVYSRYSIPKMKIEKVIFNDPATIIMWADGTKTVVKAVDEGFDPEKGLAMAISKKALGNEGNYYNTIRKYLDEYYEDVECLYPKINMVTACKNAAENLDKLKEAINKKFGNPEADK